MITPRDYARRVPTPSPSLPAKTMRTASIIILIFSAALIAFGLNMIRLGSSDANVAKDLQASGLQSTVLDARSAVGRSTGGQWSALHAELTFLGADGEVIVMETDNFPRYHPPINSISGWVDDFPTKNRIVGQPVLYRLGDSPAAVLVSEIPALTSAGWGFPHYLGLAMTALGIGAAAIGVTWLVKATRRIKLTSHRKTTRI